MWVHWGQSQLRISRADLWGDFGNELGHSLKFALHKVGAKVSVAIGHLVVPNPFLNHADRRSSHDQSADPVVSESVHTAPFQPEPTKYRVKVLTDDAVHDFRVYTNS